MYKKKFYKNKYYQANTTKLYGDRSLTSNVQGIQSKNNKIHDMQYGDYNGKKIEEVDIEYSRRNKISRERKYKSKVKYGQQHQHTKIPKNNNNKKSVQLKYKQKMIQNHFIKPETSINYLNKSENISTFPQTQSTHSQTINQHNLLQLQYNKQHIFNKTNLSRKGYKKRNKSKYQYSYKVGQLEYSCAIFEFFGNFYYVHIDKFDQGEIQKTVREIIDNIPQHNMQYANLYEQLQSLERSINVIILSKICDRIKQIKNGHILAGNSNQIKKSMQSLLQNYQFLLDQAIQKYSIQKINMML